MKEKVVLCVLTISLLAGAARGATGLDFVKEMRVRRTRWAGKLPGETIKVLAVSGPIMYSNCCTRDMLELAERMDIVVDQVSCTGGAYMSTGTLEGDRQRISELKPADGTTLKLSDPLACTVACQATAGRSVECSWQLRDEQNRIVSEGKEAVTLQPGQNEIPLRIPSPGAGHFCLDVWIAADGTTLDWGSTSLVVEGPVTIQAIRLWQDVYRTGDALDGQVEVAGAGAGDKVRLSLLDSYGRKHVETVLPLANGVRADFDLHVAQPADRVHRLEVEVVSGNTVVARGSKEVTILPAGFANYMPTGHYLGVHIGPRARFFQAFGKYYGIQAVRGARGMETARYGFIPEPFPFHLGRYGSYNEGQRWANYRNQFIASLPEWKRSGVTIVNLGDDSSIQRRLFKPNFSMSSHFPGFVTDLSRRQRRPLQQMNAKWETDFKSWKAVDRRTAVKLKEQGKPKLLDDFLAYTKERSLPVTNLDDFCLYRKYVARVYRGDVKAMNREWDTSFGSFDEITPSFIIESQKAANPAPWVDYLLYQVDGYCEVIRHLEAIVRREIPEFCIGQDASKADKAVPYLMGPGKPLTYYMPYFNEQRIKTLRYWLSQVPCGGVTMGIYGGRRVSKLARERTVMLPLANQLRGLMYWKLMGAFDGNLAVADHAGEGLEAIREAGMGLAELVLGAEWERSPVALFFSPVNEIASTLDNELSDVDSSRAAFRNMTEDLGLQTETIGPLEITGRELFQNGYRALVLPYVQALSEEEAQAIRSFVYQGGTVVGDMSPAVRDEHCKPLVKGRLDDVLGIERVKPAATAIFGDTYADPAVRATSARQRGWVGEVPAMFVHEYGAGKAILFNAYVGPYPRLRDKRKHAVHLAVWRGILANAGVAFPHITVSVGDPLAGGYDVYRYRRGSMALLGIARKPIVTRAEAVEEVVIQTPTACHAYDCRAGRYLGSGQAFKLPMRVHEVKFVALLPYRVRALDVASTGEVTQGGEVVVSLSLEGATEADSGHPIFVRLTEPSGQTAFYFDRTVRTQAGKAEVKLRLALNESPGEWRVHAREAATGIEGHTSFIVKRR